MEDDKRKALIAQYREGYAEVATALLKITDEELDRRPAPGKWSVREIVHHLGDSEMTAAVRLRLLLAQERPAIQAYDQEEFARKLHYERPHESSLALFRYAREATAELLERLSPADWSREGTHSEIGAFGVEKWLEIYAPHAHKHAAQIRAARGEVRKE
jgi:hypothetical protein